jgi:hypothetical protein
MRAWVFGIARYEIAEYRRIVKRGPVLSTLDDEFAALDEHIEITVQQREAMHHLLRSSAQPRQVRGFRLMGENMSLLDEAGDAILAYWFSHHLDPSAQPPIETPTPTRTATP